MPLFLEEAAYATWKQLPEVEKEDVKAVRAALKRVFGKSKMKAWAELKSFRILPGESVDVAAEKIKSLLNNVSSGPGAESMVALYLIDALPKVVADQIAMQHGEELDLQKVINSSKALMSSFTESAYAAVGGISKDQRQQVGRRGTTDLPASASLRCFGCKRVGHLKRDCAVICFRCQARGHIQRFCPEVSSGNGSAEAGSAGSPTPVPQH